MNDSTARAKDRIIAYGRKHGLGPDAIIELGELASGIAQEMLSEIIAQTMQQGVSHELGKS